MSTELADPTAATSVSTRRPPLTKPEKARMILLGTTSVVSIVLAVWLLTWVLFRKPGAVAAGWFGPSGLAGPVLPYQREDAGGFGRSLEIGATPGAPLKDITRAIRDIVRRGEGGPLVVYLSAPGIAYDGRPYFLPADETAFVTARAGEDALTSAESVLDALNADRARPKLLILDAGQVTTDRHLGVFGNAFLERFDALLTSHAIPNLAVLSACAPGQEGHASEPDRRSVFAYYVARGLSGAAAPWDRSGRVTVHGLTRYVRTQVARWADSHRQAVQTPVLLGDTSIDFDLRLFGEPRLAELTEDEVKALESARAELLKGWQARDRLAVMGPYRYAAAALEPVSRRPAPGRAADPGDPSRRGTRGARHDDSACQSN